MGNGPKLVKPVHVAVDSVPPSCHLPSVFGHKATYMGTLVKPARPCVPATHCHAPTDDSQAVAIGTPSHCWGLLPAPLTPFIPRAVTSELLSPNP